MIQDPINNDEGVRRDKPGNPGVVLLSGGVDSATTLAIARSEGFACHALSFDYGQRHRVELDAAKRIAEQIGVESHRWIKIDTSMGGLGGSALTGEIPVPKHRSIQQIIGSRPASPQAENHIPVTYVPARNTVFLSYALGLAEVLGSVDIFIGVTAVDYSGYPDCRPQYIEAYQRMANLATKSGVEGNPVTIHTPVIEMTKMQIVRRGIELGVDYGVTHSCYDPDDLGNACGGCDSCLLRQNAFEQLGLTDPALGRIPADED